MKKNFQSLVRIIKELGYILDGKQKKGAIWLFVVIVISSILELLGISAILPFVQAVTSPEELMKNKYMKTIANMLHLSRTDQILLLLGICLIILYIVKNILLMYSSYVQYDYASRIQMQLSVKMMNSYMERPYLYFTDTNSSEIIRGCSADISSVYNIIAMLTDILTQFFTVVAIGMFLVYTDPITAISVLMMMVLLLICIVLFFKPLVKKSGKESLKLSTEMTKVLYQAINGIKEIIVMQRGELFQETYEKASDANRKIQRQYNTLNAFPDRIVEGICIGSIIGIACVRLTSSKEDMITFIPKLAAFAVGAFKILPSIGKIASRMNVVIFSMPGLDNVYTNIKEANKIHKKKAYLEEKGDINISFKSIPFRKELVIEHIFWQYLNSVTPVLEDVSIRINKGESVAFIGESGAGKTTLSDIILGLIKPIRGSIKMDGTDIYTMPQKWAHIVGYVPQNVYLFDDTIRNNIAFGLSADMVEDVRVWEALDRAQLKKYIMQLPYGLDTIVGEQGVKMSGGQRQRIAIARALYNEPEILVLDEATASLDNETEAAVMESIDALQGKITMIIVAHRLSTIRSCDKIYEIKNGHAYYREKKEVFGEQRKV